MANETEAAAAQPINGQGEAHVISSTTDELNLVSEAVRTLPPLAVKDLLSIGVRFILNFSLNYCSNSLAKFLA